MRADHSLKQSGFTLRALVLGALMAVIVNIGDPFSYNLLRSSLLAHDYLPLGVVFPFIIIVVIFNVCLKLLNRRFALTPAELIVMFVMGLVGSTIASNTTGYLLSIIAAPYYFATPENQWAQYLHQHIPSWMVPGGGGGNASKWYFEGLPEGEKIPWGEWVIPLAWWLSLIMVVFFVCFCLVVILRKQWVEKERLIFPLAEVPMEMARDSDSRNLLPAFMRDKMFWLGFALPLIVIIWNIFNYFNPLFPEIPLRTSISIARDFPNINTYIYFPLIGFAYLINLDVSFSIWFFYVLGVIQIGIFNRIGLALGSADVYCSENVPLSWQGWGAFLVMVLWGLWMARKHLRDVFKKAFNKNCDVDDSEEMMSYRTAVFGLIFGLIYISAWLYRSGMNDPKVLLIFLAGAIILFIGITRIVVECGLVFLRAPMISQSFTIFTLGANAISPSNMVALAFSYIWTSDLKSIFMAAAAHAAKLRDMVRAHKKAIVMAIWIAVLVSFATSIPYTLNIAYEHGAYNFGRWIFTGGSTTPFESVVQKMRNPFGTFWKGLTFLGIGGVVMAGLLFMRYRFVWWPIHPVGFTIASILPIRLSAFSIFLAWAAKAIILKIGGVKLYRTFRPFFFGLIVGAFFGVGISFVVDLIWFPGRGHEIYGW